MSTLILSELSASERHRLGLDESVHDAKPVSRRCPDFLEPRSPVIERKPWWQTSQSESPASIKTEIGKHAEKPCWNRPLLTRTVLLVG